MPRLLWNRRVTAIFLPTIMTVSMLGCEGNSSKPVESAGIGKRLRLSQLNGIWAGCDAKNKQLNTYSFFNEGSTFKGTLRQSKFLDEECNTRDEVQPEALYPFQFVIGNETLAGGFIELVFGFSKFGNKSLRMIVEYKFADESVSLLIMPDLTANLTSPPLEETSETRVNMHLANQKNFVTVARLANESDTDLIRKQLTEAFRPRLENKLFVGCNQRLGRLVRFDSYFAEADVIHGTFVHGSFPVDGCINPGDQTQSLAFQLKLAGPEDFTNPWLFDADIRSEEFDHVIKTKIDIRSESTIIFIDLSKFQQNPSIDRIVPSQSIDTLELVSSRIILKGSWASEHCYQESDDSWNYKLNFTFDDKTWSVTRTNYIKQKETSSQPCLQEWSQEVLAGMGYRTTGTGERRIESSFAGQDALTYQITSTDYPRVGYFYSCSESVTESCVAKANTFLQKLILILNQAEDSFEFVLVQDENIRFVKDTTQSP